MCNLIFRRQKFNPIQIVKKPLLCLIVSYFVFIRAVSSVGRATPLRGVGQRFDSSIAHIKISEAHFYVRDKKVTNLLARGVESRSLRRQTRRGRGIFQQKNIRDRPLYHIYF